MRKMYILFLVSVVTVSWFCIPGLSRLTAAPFSFPPGDDKKIDTDTTKFFIPVDSQTKETLEDVEYEICIIDQDNRAFFPGNGIFKKRNKKLVVNYPSACRKVLLTLKKEGYEDCLKDISVSSSKSTPAPNPIEMNKMEISQSPSTSPIETTTSIKVSISNEDNYNGKVILTDNLGRHYTKQITLAAHQHEIDGKEIKVARLDPEFLQENGKKYRIYIKKEGNECEIIPIEETKLVFNFTLNTCGEPRPLETTLYLDGVFNQYGDPQDIVSFKIDSQRDNFQYSRSVAVDPSKPVINAFIMDDLFGKIPCAVKENVVYAEINCCKPALAVVIFITNSKKAFLKQEIIDKEIRPVFALRSYFKALYVGWISYDRTSFQLNDFKNIADRQINISDINTIDSVDDSFKKIIKNIKTKFTGINMRNGQKQAADRLVIVLDKCTIRQAADYSSENVKVKLIDINDFITGSNEQFFNLIKEN